MLPKWSTLLLLCVLLLAMGCTSKDKKESLSTAEPKTIILEPHDFKTKFSETPDAVLIDVRTPEEVSEGMIEGAINVDFKDAQFTQKINAFDKEKTYFVYCLSGKRSGEALKQMEQAGFKNLYTLKDGYQNWTKEGLETVKP